MKNYDVNTLNPILINLADGDQNSDMFPLEGYSIGSMQIVWSGVDSTDAVCQVQTTDSNGVAWDDKSGASVTLDAATGSGSLSFASNFSSQAIRINTTVNTATAGTVTVYITRKG